MKTLLPNVVLFTWHDAGNWFGCCGHPTVSTPGVDRLASGGARFARNFSACAICSPSRAAMLTGRLCQANGVMGLTNTVFDNRIRPGCTHLSLRLRDAGYDTALVGIQHECAHEHVHQVIAPAGQFLTDPWREAGAAVPVVRRWICDRATRQTDTPFFLQVGTFEAHLGRFFRDVPAASDEPYPPVQDTSRGLATPGYLAGSPADSACIATLQGLLQRGDRLMTALLDALDETGLAEDTIVMMAVDHGVGLARAKTHCYEPGLHTAWIMRWPGRIAQGLEISDVSTHVDVVPTLLGLLGLPAGEDLDGWDFSPRLLGRSAAPPPRKGVFGHMTETARTLRTDRWRLVRHFRPPSWPGRPGDCATLHAGFRDAAPRPPAENPAERLELFDAEADPDNLHNLAGDPRHEETLRELDGLLWDFLLDHDDFVLHETIQSPWQEATRADLEAHGRRTGRPLPSAVRSA